MQNDAFSLNKHLNIILLHASTYEGLYHLHVHSSLSRVLASQLGSALFHHCYLTLGDEITEITSTVAHVITDSLSLEIMHEYWPASFIAAFLI